MKIATRGEGGRFIHGANPSPFGYANDSLEDAVGYGSARPKCNLQGMGFARWVPCQLMEDGAGDETRTWKDGILATR